MKRLLEYLKGRKELFMTYKIEILSNVLNILKEHNIQYYILSKYEGSANRRTGSWKTFFERTEYEMQYYVYVDRNSYENAKYILREHYKEDNRWWTSILKK